MSGGPSDGQRLVRFTRRRAVQRYARLVHRMVQMGPGELADRLRRSGLARRLRGAGAPAAPVLSAPLGAGALREALDTRFFFGPRSLADRLLDLPPDAARALRDAAHALVAEGAVVFGTRVALDPERIDWQADPVSGRRLWPSVPLDEAGAVASTRAAGLAEGADVKYVWELNRHQFLPTLACAGLLEEEPRYASLAIALVDRWRSQNPPGEGVNWSSGLEVGLRAISWLWTLALVSPWPWFSDEIAARWGAGLAEHYDYLRRNLSTYADPTNHLIGELAALWTLAVVLPELPGAAEEAARALAMLTAEVERQVTPDGVSREQSVGYHCFVLDFYLPVVALARRNGIAVAAELEARLRSMLGFLDRIVGEGGALPQIGDGDEGRGLPYPRPVGETERAEALLAAGTCLLGSPSGSPRSELPVWLAGAHAAASARPPRTSTLFAEGGYAFLEGDTRRGRRLQLTVDVGGLGYLPNGAHEHADALGVVLRVDGHLVLGDPGTGCYTGAAAVRDRLRGTASHNTVTVDGLDQADVFDTFKWLNPPRTALLRWHTSARLDHVAAEHDGYVRLRRPVRHRREVLFVRPEYWVVADHLSGAGRHLVTRWFHFPPGVALTLAGRVVEIEVPGVGMVARLVFADLGSPAGADLHLESAPWSPSYGRVQPAPCLRAVTHAVLPMTLVTLILADDATVPALEPHGSRECRIEARDGEGSVDTLGVGRDGWLVHRRCDAAGRVLFGVEGGQVRSAEEQGG